MNSKKIECPCCGYPHEIAGKIKEARRNKMIKQKRGETPRTDEYLRRRKENGHTVVVSSDFARQLEVELAAAIAELRILEEKMNNKQLNLIMGGLTEDDVIELVDYYIQNDFYATNLQAIYNALNMIKLTKEKIK